VAGVARSAGIVCAEEDLLVSAHSIDGTTPNIITARNNAVDKRMVMIRLFI